MAYLGLRDLVKRWIYSRQGVYKLAARDRDFPEPKFTINVGRTPVWHVADIEAYEKVRPELTSEAAKHLKQAGYARAKLKKGRA